MTESARASWMIGEGKSLPPEFDDGVVWAAWLYYVDQLTQSDIAKILGMSRATIVNYLQEARERGLVTIRVNTDVGGRVAVARKLKDKFGLEGALVIPAGEPASLVTRLGEAGARLLADMIKQGDTIGVAWGRTVLAVADQISLAEALDGLTVVQVSGSSIANPEFSPEFCTSLMSQRIHARCVNLLAPALLSTPELKRWLLSEPVLVKQFELIHSTNILVFGVGDIGPDTLIRSANVASQEDFDSYQAHGAVAVLICRFIDEAGRQVSGELDDRMVGIELDELVRIPSRVCVAGGANKVTAIRATMNGGYATHLVTDIETAEMLLAEGA